VEDRLVLEDNQRPNILVVDDEQAVLDTLQLLFEERWDVFTAISADEAKRILREHEIALILADERMPGESGVDLLAWASQHHPGAMRLLLTGYADAEKIIRSINEGRIWHYLRKPCNNRELLNLVERALEFRAGQIEVRRSERRYRELFHHAHVGIARLDLDGNIIEGNQSLAESLGCPNVDELIDLNLAQMCQERQNWLTLRKQLIQDRAVRNAELSLVDCHKRHVYLLINAALRRTEGGEPFVEASLLDFTDHRITSKENSELKEHLRRVQRQETVATLSNGVIHDFNNQMTVIMSAAFVAELSLEDGEQEPGELKECLAAVRAAADHAAQLSRQLLSFTRGSGFNPEPLNVNRAAKRAVRMLSWAVARDIRVDLRLDESVPPIKADSAQVHQCLLNLCLNGCQAMDRGGCLTLETGTRHCPASPGDQVSRRWVEIRVRDTGSGMTEELRQKVFEPFFTTKRNEEGGGTGLGLWMVANIVKQHEGEVEVESQVGQGSCFSLRFPAHEERPRPSYIPRPLERTSQRGTIVLADDEPSLRRLVAHALTKLGFQVLRAANGQEAVGHVQRQPDSVRLVILDAVMPLMDGEEAFGKIRSQFPHLPVLFTTGFIVTGRLQEALKADQVGLLLKPFDATALCEAVNGLVLA
jgi:PAS domain S-box-containing protein